MTGRGGFSFLELTVIVTVVAVIAAASAAIVAPQVNLFLYFPERTRIQSVATDLMDVILEGDSQARGLRYAAPVPSLTPGAAPPNAITLVSATYGATTYTDRLRYTYVDYGDQTTTHLGTPVYRTNYQVTLTASGNFSTGAGQVTRQVTRRIYRRGLGTSSTTVSGPTQVIPVYLSTSRTAILPPTAPVAAADRRFFRYYDVNNNAIAPVTAAQIAGVYRVDVSFVAMTRPATGAGTGDVKRNQARFFAKSSAEIKRAVDCAGATPCY